MKKVIGLFGLLIIVIGVGFIFFKPRTTTFPYTFGHWIPMEREKAQNADILVIGDRLGIWLDRFLPTLSQKFNKRPRIYNWSAKHEGLHRGLYKLLSLKKFPPVIIYHGGSEEFFERRFSLIGPKAIEDKRVLNDLSKLKSIERIYRIFSQEFQKFIDTIISHNSKLIVITPPINILKEYKRICSQSTTPSLNKKSDAMELSVKEGRGELIVKEISQLIKISPTNARLHYILGRAYLRLGRYKKAAESLNKAAIFDCETWRGHLVFNRIMMNKALKAKQRVIDFHGDLHTLLGKSNLFRDDIYPQDIYYKVLIDKLAKLLAPAFKEADGVNTK